MSEGKTRPKPEPTPMDKMRELTRRLVAVPKSEIGKRKQSRRKRRTK